MLPFYKNLFWLWNILGGNEGFIVFLFVHVRDPIIIIKHITNVRLGLKVLSKVSLIKK